MTPRHFDVLVTAPIPAGADTDDDAQ